MNKKELEYRIKELELELSLTKSEVISCKLTEQDLKEREEFYISMFENSPAAVSMIEPDTTISMVNNEYCKISGYSKDEVIGMSWTQQVTPIDLERLKEFDHRNKIDSDDVPHKYEFSFYRKNGELRHAILFTANLRNNKKIASFVDVTERKQAEWALKESELKLNYFFNQATVGAFFMMLDEPIVWNDSVDKKNVMNYVFEHHRITKVNQAMLEQYKTTEKDFIGLTPKDLFAHDLEYGQRILTEFFDKGKLHVDTDERRFDGSQMWVLGDYTCMYDSQGRVTGHFGLQIDITERKKTEEELQNKQLLLRSLIDNIPDIIYSKDLESRKTLINLAEIHNLGAESESEVLGKDDFDFYPKEIAERFMADDKSVMQKGIPLINREEFSFNKRGQKYWLLTSKIPLRNQKGQIIGLIGIGRNITERKQAELALKESEAKLRQLNIDKDRFISILGHDLKSPFNNLLGLSELLAKNIHKYDIDKIDNLAIDINKSAQRSFNLLDDLLTWARAQNGNIPFKPQNLSLTDICNEVLEILNPTADAKNITINYSTANHLNVFADTDMLKTVLRNLVSNAIKFTNLGGVINISGEQTDSDVTISVHDNGIGITPENLAKLFDISEVLTTKGTKGETGTGLGLLLCKEFVEKHGGKIWVESEVNKGSDFRFTMPCNAEPKLI